MPEEIPYEEIDCEIRRLVRLINAFPGIRTVSSCVGHEPNAETHVTFSAESQEAVVRLLSTLPLFGYRAGFANNHAFWRVVWLTASLSVEGTLDYTLRIGGFPCHVQRETLDEVERALCAATEAFLELHPPCSIGGSFGSEDTTPCCPSAWRTQTTAHRNPCP